MEVNPDFAACAIPQDYDILADWGAISNQNN